MRWSRNKSGRYDGVVQEIDTNCVHPEDLATMAVGKTTRIKWFGRTWFGEVIRLPSEETSASEPPKKRTKRMADSGKSSH